MSFMYPSKTSPSNTIHNQWQGRRTGAFGFVIDTRAYAMPGVERKQIAG